MDKIAYAPRINGIKSAHKVYHILKHIYDPVGDCKIILVGSHMLRNKCDMTINKFGHKML